MLAISFGTVGCSHNVTSELPASPTPVTPTIKAVKLTITPPGGGSMLVGSVVPITTSGPLPSDGLALGAYAQYSDGSGTFVEANWTSSDANVAIVRDATLVGIGRGSATLTATAMGLTATETFTVEPGIPGRWSGHYIVDTCQAGSASMDELICNAGVAGRPPGLFLVGKSAPIAMQITQNGKDLTAAAQLGELRGVLSGTDRGGNFLTLLGPVSVDRMTVTIIYWDTRVRQDAMEGFIGYDVRIDGIPGAARIAAHLDNVTRR